MTAPPRVAIELRGLDALRGALAVYVLIGHARWLLWTGHAAWMSAPHSAWQEPLVYASGVFRYGREAVLIFFALSGFFIHFRAAEAIGRHQPVHLSVSSYAGRRAHRLAPTYFFALAVTVALDTLGRWQFPELYEARTGDALLDGVFGRGGYEPASVVPALAMLPSSMGRDFGSNGPLWSLGYELVYYALYPAWLSVRRRSAALAFGAVPIACLAVITLAPGSFVTTVVGWYPVWLCGAAVVEALTGAVHIRHRMSLPLFAAGLAGYLMSASPQLQVVFAVVFAGAAVLTWATLDAARAGMALDAAQFLGRRSYTIYVMHFPIVALLSAASFTLLGARPSHGWLALVGVGSTLLCCFGLFHLCERHFLHERFTIERAKAA